MLSTFKVTYQYLTDTGSAVLVVNKSAADAQALLQQHEVQVSQDRMVVIRMKHSLESPAIKAGTLVAFPAKNVFRMFVEKIEGEPTA